MLTYHWPKTNCSACAALSVASPRIGLSTAPPCLLNQIVTGPLAPGAAGPWKCAIVGALDRSLKESDQVTTRVAGSNVTSAVAVAGVETAGTSSAPERLTVNETGAACARLTQARAARALTPIAKRRVAMRVMTDSLRCSPLEL